MMNASRHGRIVVCSAASRRSKAHARSHAREERASLSLVGAAFRRADGVREGDRGGFPEEQRRRARVLTGGGERGC